MDRESRDKLKKQYKYVTGGEGQNQRRSRHVCLQNKKHVTGIIFSTADCAITNHPSGRDCCCRRRHCRHCHCQHYGQANM